MITTKDRLEACLDERIGFLKSIIEKKRKELKQAPPGTLRISKGKKKNLPRVQYYHRTSKEENNGTYLKKEQEALIRALAQKDYNEKVLYQAENEFRILIRMKTQADKYCPESVAEVISEARRELISPIWLSDQEMINDWQSFQYQPKEMRDDFAEFYTERGERVRSKSEVIIANLLNSMSIPYRYECPLKLSNGIIIHPDFTVLHVNEGKTMFLEHLGMMDDISYNERAIERISLYESDGYYLGESLIITYETRRKPINIRHLQAKFQHVFID